MSRYSDSPESRMMDEHFAVLFGKGEHQSPEPEPEPLPDGAIMAAPSQSDLARKARKATVESPKEAFKPPKPPPVEARVTTTDRDTCRRAAVLRQ